MSQLQINRPFYRAAETVKIGHCSKKLYNFGCIIIKVSLLLYKFIKSLQNIILPLRSWPESEFRRAGVLDELTSTLSKTLQDPDHEARQTAREGFFCLSEKFPEEAERVKADLPPQAQKRLQMSSLSRTGSQDSLASNGSAASSHGSVRTPGRGRPRNFTSSVSRTPGSRTPKFTPKPLTPVGFGRSRSDLDPAALHRFGPAGSSNGLTKTATPKKYQNIESRYSQSRMKSTPGRSKPTMSQPGSRSGSPPQSFDSVTKRRTPSRIPRSAASSRESSPDGYRSMDR